MKLFEDVRNKEIRYRKFEMMGYTIYVYFIVDKRDFYLKFKTKRLVESHKLLLEYCTPLNSTYSVRKDTDKSHIPPDPNKTHLHVFKNGNEIFAINKDGTAHDKSAGKKIPGAIFNTLKQKYPDFSFPPNRIIREMLINADLKEVTIPYLEDENLNAIICEAMDNNYMEQLDNILEQIDSDKN